MRCKNTHTEVNVMFIVSTLTHTITRVLIIHTQNQSDVVYFYLKTVVCVMSVMVMLSDALSILTHIMAQCLH